jgi:S1-C subfamily serine protease
MRTFIFALLLAAFASPANAALKDEATDTVLRFGAADRVLCSAVVVEREKVLTANHCVEHVLANKLGGMWVEQGGKRHRVAAATPEGSDTALLIAPGVECPCAVIDRAPVAKGEKVVTIGFPSGVAVPAQEGFASDYDTPAARYKDIGVDENDPFAQRRLLFHNAVTAPGMSGGGVFTERDGKWVLVGTNSVALALPFIGFVESGASPATEWRQF